MDKQMILTTDVNNNSFSPEEKEYDDTVELKHSKFCHSQILSNKEESLLRNNNESSSCTNATSLTRPPCKKTVTFDRSSPILIESEQEKFRDLDSDSDDNLGRKAYQVHFDTDDTDSLSPSESEIFDNKMDTLSQSYDIISCAEEKLVPVINELQTLWLNLQESSVDYVINHPPPNPGDNRLMQKISLLAWITERLSMEYRKNLDVTSDANKIAKLQAANDLLQEELKNSKQKVVLYTRENNALACKIAAEKFNANNKPQEAEIFYKNPHPCFEASDSKSFGGADEIQNPRNQFKTDSEHVDSQDQMLILKRENEMNSIIKALNEKFGTNNKIQEYNENLENWMKMLQITNEEKQSMFQDLIKIVQEHKAVLKERDHYEFILKLIIQEKFNDDSDIKRLLNTLLVKLHEPSFDNGSSMQTSLLEGAVQALQQQNANHREEIYRLKHVLSEYQMCNEAQAKELESCNKKIAKFLNELNSDEAKFKIMQEEAQGKCDKVQELCNDAVAAKAALEQKLEDKEEELKCIQEALRALRKTNKKTHKKYHELHKTNNILIKEIKESKGNMDHLAEIISQLRVGLKDQKSQWNDRLRISSDEVSQSKQHCEWLKSQMEQINQQLKDANERLKLHEMDKVQLAQQLLLAEEERRVVDRKLQELRTALQGDTGLREALIERNEELQLEINRLRHGKLRNMATGSEDSPPLEMRFTNELLSAVLLPRTETPHNTDKLIVKKNCYTSTYRRPNDIPRTAVSLHNGGGK